mgnify:CR=1 FL=1
MGTRVIALKGKEDKIKNFYPTLYHDEVKEIIGSYKNGDIVDIVDAEFAFIARGYINENSNALVRVMSLKEEVIDKNFFKQKIKKAYERRNHLNKETNCIRLFYSEADGIPGLIVDKFDKYLSVQFRTLGIERYRDDIIKALKEVVKPKAIYDRSDVETRVKEGIEMTSGSVMGEIPELIVMEDNGLKFGIDIVNGQKTGFFLDQRESRKFIRKYINKSTRFLDVFSSSGGFSMAALAEGAQKVVAVDKSADALKLAKANYELNGFEGNFSTIEGDAFQILKVIASRGEKYDICVLDPPSLIKKKEDNRRGRDFFYDLANDGFKLLSDGGIMGVCTCAYHISLQDLVEVTRMAASKNGKMLEVLGVSYQPDDHPWILHIPETLYLKCLWVRIVN